MKLKKNLKLYILIGVLLVSAISLVGYIIYDKVIDKKESSVNYNIKEYAGSYEILAKGPDPKNIFKGFYELEIKEDSSFILKYSESFGDKQSYEGKCILNKSEIILMPTSSSNLVKELKFKINSDKTLSYFDEDTTIILRKKRKN